MKELVNHIINALRTDKTNTLKEIGQATGINTTRVFRLKSGKLPDAEELAALADFYKISPSGMTTEEINKARQNAIRQAWTSVYEKAETSIAEKYGITVEALQWKLASPELKKIGNA